FRLGTLAGLLGLHHRPHGVLALHGRLRRVALALDHEEGPPTAQGEQDPQQEAQEERQRRPALAALVLGHGVSPSSWQARSMPYARAPAGASATRSLTSLRMSARTASEEMFSACASKFNRMRWRSAGRYTFLTSSTLTLNRPSSIARTLPASTSAW